MSSTIADDLDSSAYVFLKGLSESGQIASYLREFRYGVEPTLDEFSTTHFGFPRFPPLFTSSDFTVPSGYVNLLYDYSTKPIMVSDLINPEIQNFNSRLTLCHFPILLMLRTGQHVRMKSYHSQMLDAAQCHMNISNRDVMDLPHLVNRFSDVPDGSKRLADLPFLIVKDVSRHLSKRRDVSEEGLVTVFDYDPKTRRETSYAVRLKPFLLKYDDGSVYADSIHVSGSDVTFLTSRYARRLERSTSYMSSLRNCRAGDGSSKMKAWFILPHNYGDSDMIVEKFCCRPESEFDVGGRLISSISISPFYSCIYKFSAMAHELSYLGDRDVYSTISDWLELNSPFGTFSIYSMYESAFLAILLNPPLFARAFRKSFPADDMPMRWFLSVYCEHRNLSEVTDIMGHEHMSSNIVKVITRLPDGKFTQEGIGKIVCNVGQAKNNGLDWRRRPHESEQSYMSRICCEGFYSVKGSFEDKINDLLSARGCSYDFSFDSLWGLLFYAFCGNCACDDIPAACNQALRLFYIVGYLGSNTIISTANTNLTSQERFRSYGKDYDETIDKMRKGSIESANRSERSAAMYMTNLKTIGRAVGEELRSDPATIDWNECIRKFPHDVTGKSSGNYSITFVEKEDAIRLGTKIKHDMSGLSKISGNTKDLALLTASFQMLANLILMGDSRNYVANKLHSDAPVFSGTLRKASDLVRDHDGTMIVGDDSYKRVIELEKRLDMLYGHIQERGLANQDEIRYIKAELAELYEANDIVLGRDASIDSVISLAMDIIDEIENDDSTTHPCNLIPNFPHLVASFRSVQGKESRTILVQMIECHLMTGMIMRAMKRVLRNPPELHHLGSQQNQYEIDIVNMRDGSGSSSLAMRIQSHALKTYGWNRAITIGADGSSFDNHVMLFVKQTLYVAQLAGFFGRDANVDDLWNMSYVDLELSIGDIRKKIGMSASPLAVAYYALCTSVSPVIGHKSMSGLLLFIADKVGSGEFVTACLNSIANMSQQDRGLFDPYLIQIAADDECIVTSLDATGIYSGGFEAAYQKGKQLGDNCKELCDSRNGLGHNYNPGACNLGDSTVVFLKKMIKHGMVVGYAFDQLARETKKGAMSFSSIISTLINNAFTSAERNCVPRRVETYMYCLYAFMSSINYHWKPFNDRLGEKHVFLHLSVRRLWTKGGCSMTWGLGPMTNAFKIIAGSVPDVQAAFTGYEFDLEGVESEDDIKIPPAVSINLTREKKSLGTVNIDVAKAFYKKLYCFEPDDDTSVLIRDTYPDLTASAGFDSSIKQIYSNISKDKGMEGSTDKKYILKAATKGPSVVACPTMCVTLDIKSSSPKSCYGSFNNACINSSAVNLIDGIVGHAMTPTIVDRLLDIMASPPAIAKFAQLSVDSVPRLKALWSEYGQKGLDAIGLDYKDFDRLVRYDEVYGNIGITRSLSTGSWYSEIWGTSDFHLILRDHYGVSSFEEDKAQREDIEDIILKLAQISVSITLAYHSIDHSCIKWLCW